jgi:MSHA pilin protein MshC
LITEPYPHCYVGLVIINIFSIPKVFDFFISIIVLSFQCVGIVALIILREAIERFFKKSDTKMNLSMKIPLNNKHGFTMMEVIAVLLIIGIIAAVVVSRMGDTSSYDLAAQMEVVRAHLRLAQSRAMSSGSPCGICFNSAKTYYLFQGDGSTTEVQLPGEDDKIVNLTTKKSGLTIDAIGSVPPPQRITFDAYGSPGTMTVTVNTNGGDIIVTKNTGFIP